jgi:DnaJ-class molecular chaperone
MQSYYDILGVDAQCSADELKSAYRKLARQYHPDVHGDERMFKLVTEAYEALLTMPAPVPEPPKSHEQPNTFTPGEDIYADITISVKDAAVGTTRTVNIMQSVQCPGCGGSKCKACSHTGTVTKHKKIKVTIPKNIKDGHKLRVKGEGNDGGDLYLTIHINGAVKYDGVNILYSLPLAPYQAVLGTEATIPVFDGNRYLTIPPMTNSGQTFRLAGQGRVSVEGERGDMIVTVHIEIPSSLAQNEIRLYEKLRRLHERKKS